MVPKRLEAVARLHAHRWVLDRHTITFHGKPVAVMACSDPECSATWLDLENAA